MFTTVAHFLLITEYCAATCCRVDSTLPVGGSVTMRSGESSCSNIPHLANSATAGLGNSPQLVQTEVMVNVTSRWVCFSRVDGGSSCNDSLRWSTSDRCQGVFGVVCQDECGWGFCRSGFRLFSVMMLQVWSSKKKKSVPDCPAEW